MQELFFKRIKEKQNGQTEVLPYEMEKQPKDDISLDLQVSINDEMNSEYIEFNNNTAPDEKKFEYFTNFKDPIKPSENVPDFLPFKTDQEIDRFFEKEENLDKLFDFAKNYFNDFSKIARVMKLLLNFEYLSTHLWVGGPNGLKSCKRKDAKKVDRFCTNSA